MLKKLLSLSICSIFLSVSACSSSVNQIAPATQVEKSSSSDTYVADVGGGKLGASFMAKIDVAQGFNVKAPLGGNVDGKVAKTNADLAKVDVYLLELAAAPTAGSDPLASVVTNGTVLNISKTGASFSVLFKNVPANTSGKKYYVGIVAKDTNGIVISKNPATDWTGASANKGLVITNGGGDSSGSVSVNTSLVVSNAASLTVSIPLLDAIGAQVNSTATVTDGSSTLPNISAQ